MKKLIAILALAVMLLTALTIGAGAEGTQLRNGVTFGMDMDQVMAAEPARYHEIDRERTHGPVAFWELEYENVQEMGARADLKYLFVGNALVALRVDFEDRSIGYEQVKAELTAQYGAAKAPDLTKLGNGIFAADDDGHLEWGAEAFEKDGMMVILERDDDDVTVTYVDLNAAFISAR